MKTNIFNAIQKIKTQNNNEVVLKFMSSLEKHL